MRWLVLLLLAGCVSQVDAPASYPDTYAEIERQLLEEADDLGVKIVKTDRNRSITFRNTIYLSARFGSHPASRVNLLSHELEHSRQYRRERAFLLRYVFSARFRYRMERAALEEEVRAMQAVGCPPKEVENALQRFEDSLQDMYLIRRR